MWQNHHGMVIMVLILQWDPLAQILTLALGLAEVNVTLHGCKEAFYQILLQGKAYICS